MSLIRNALEARAADTPPRKEGRPLGRDITRSLARVAITDMFNPGNRLITGLLNPDVLSYSISVEIGQLNPVGWSHGVVQYGHTKSISVPLDLYFSTQLTPRRGGHRDIQWYVDWFAAFCFPQDNGIAPPPMLLVWPKVMDIALVVEDFSADYVRFHEDLSPGAVHVAIEALELRHTFRTAGKVRSDGLRRADPLLSRYAGTGSPLNFKGGGDR